MKGNDRKYYIIIITLQNSQLSCRINCKNKVNYNKSIECSANYTNKIENKDGNNEYEPFNREQAIEHFHNGFIYNQESLKKELPKAILKQIADVRVFALNKATHTVINAVTKFCEDNEKSVRATSKNYRRHMEKVSNTLDKEIIEKFGFHDCTIIKSVQNDTSLTLHLNNTGGFTDIDEVTFENFNIIKQDDLLEDAWWLYEEVYKVNDKYEFHVLLQNGKMGLIDFIISAEHVSFISK